MKNLAILFITIFLAGLYSCNEVGPELSNSTLFEKKGMVDSMYNTDGNSNYKHFISLGTINYTLASKIRLKMKITGNAQVLNPPIVISDSTGRTYYVRNSNIQGTINLDTVENTPTTNLPTVLILSVGYQYQWLCIDDLEILKEN